MLISDLLGSQFIVSRTVETLCGFGQCCLLLAWLSLSTWLRISLTLISDKIELFQVRRCLVKNALGLLWRFQPTADSVQVDCILNRYKDYFSADYAPCRLWRRHSTSTTEESVGCQADKPWVKQIMTDKCCALVCLRIQFDSSWSCCLRFVICALQCV